MAQAECRSGKCGIFRDTCPHGKRHDIVVFYDTEKPNELKTCVNFDFVCIASLRGSCCEVLENE